MLVAIAMLALAIHTSGSANPRSRLALVGAVVVLAAAFISPLCALASALFSARVAHHVMLIAVAAPLLVLAAPRWRLPRLLPLPAIALAHAVLVWFWHAPAPYMWALSGTAPYWLMEVSLLLSAFWLWSELLRPDQGSGTSLAALLGTILQMGFLGAILTFARQPLYEAHALTTLPFGLTQLEDQQLAGLLMWVPAAAPYLIAAAVIARRFFPSTSDTRTTWG